MPELNAVTVTERASFGGRGKQAGMPLRRPGGFSVFGVVLLLGLVIAPRSVNSYDGGIMLQVAEGIVRQGTALVHPVDLAGLNMPYSGYGLGQSLVMGLLMLLPGSDVTAAGMSCALLIAGTAWVAYRISVRNGADRRIAMIVAVLIVLATPLLVYMGSMFSEPGVALGVATVTLGLLRARDGEDGAVLVGVGVGTAVLFRSDSLLLVALPSFAALGLIARQQLVRVAVWVAPFLTVWAWYNMARFGSPISSGYDGQGFSHPFPTGVVGLLISPGKGLVIHLTVIVAALCAVRRWRDPLVWFAIVMLGSRVLFYASWWAWQGGSSVGPRFLLPAVPAFVPLLVVAVQRWGRSLWFVSLVAGSVLVQVGGVAVMRQGFGGYYMPPVYGCVGPDYMAAVTSPEYVDEADRIQFEWSRFPGLRAEPDRGTSC